VYEKDVHYEWLHCDECYGKWPRNEMNYDLNTNTYVCDDITITSNDGGMTETFRNKAPINLGGNANDGGLNPDYDPNATTSTGGTTNNE